MNYSVYSTEYLEQDVSSYNCYLKEEEWNRITSEFPNKRIFARIINGENQWIVALGEPISSFENVVFESRVISNGNDSSNNDNSKSIFVPNWMIEQIQISGDGSTYEVDWMPSDVFDNSTHIVLKAEEYMYQNDDIQEQLSNELTKVGILQKYSVIHIQMPSLDNFVIKYRVVDLSPASVVLCEGDEVGLEFIEETVAPFRSVVGRPPSPYPQIPELLSPSENLAYLPENNTVPTNPPTEGLTLGGVKREGKFNPWRSKDFKPSSM